ncbi:dipeptide/oligopeptide/nickel ABC transporter permease/ATP-binding protein [Arcanobacterium haemolyticum]|uniref:Oligopeptide/dipeptide ABC transporter, ATPase subunit n=1 Tax=Arcanobacterium haemolyticum (strain ATCC 9345 / DSM 20595 / CCM 5947 / CCUG 17215 / LMG 16163 / NBRC 15585 / NCTC 8452 / 11018) TaxID=644284 RepID=D7BP34_ARCHD|nr:dipeptide/oligopeptide/nickel ABC transporter permease/ATP-binding protein [Arcanobacterium haemolyticum]ADH92683.1 oligopeptide/dipeptide ABC transporter, ATPase subunit [Arcanobacterium haemolyticum DSM 20595]QCX46793.1 dipeptide/oligopeptide/nickel ABC transporter permease/ATP-binding protein [Arcanobacterium haemolyticum]SPT74804.1 Glutathione import ATP-binding protein GsiA [Arcanobacterium haemolyticum]SQH28580.1 Glutathione import ATP-binding protein GsiA [Arcanobacterium haemolyticum
MGKKEKLNKVTKPGAKFSRISNMSLGARIALGLLTTIAFISLIAPFIAPYAPDAIFDKWAAPSGEHFFGTDHVGRDIFTRLLYGGRFSLIIGLCATAIALFFGAIIGSIAAVVRKSISEVIMRILDIIMAVPGIAMAAVTVLVFSARFSSDNLAGILLVIICSIAFVYTPQLARIVRANVMSAYGEDYVRAVVVSGARAPWILIKHVMRNTAAPVLVFATVLVADAIILEASLTFIGSGLQSAMVPTWGNVLSDASANMSVMLGKWWTAFFPGILIMITVLCLNILSEGITDAMVAAPKGVSVAQVASSSKRKADMLLLDPRKAYAEQAESLQARINALHTVETQRNDRFMADPSVTPLLEVKNFSIKFPRHGDVNVVDNVSFSVAPGETMGLVGESGCGKSITALSIMGLIDPRAELSGELLYQGKNLLEMSVKERQALLGHEMAMIYQDALSSLNPAMLIKAQMKQLTSRGGTRSAEELLELVGLDPKRTLESYPHELSGGQRQRVLIAMALTRDPKLVIADEPTTALDVTVQKQVIALLNELREKLGFAMIFVSHDLALVAEVAHSITVMYAGQVIEQAPTSELLLHPTHEYTRGLLGAVLSIESGSGRLHQVPGTVPSPKDFPIGDRFAPRSSHPDYGLDIRPVLTEVGPRHYYAALPPRPEQATETQKAGEAL